MQKTYGYDPAGRLTNVDAMTFTYDTRNLLTSATMPGGVGTWFEYDQGYNMTKRTQTNYYGGQDVYTFGYNARDEVGLLTDPTSTYAKNQWYNLAGQVAGNSHGYSRHNYSYDAVGRLSGDVNLDAWQTVTWASTTYGYNTDDNLATKTVSIPANSTPGIWPISANSSSGVHSYTYDNADRLKTWVAPGASVTYDCDKACNRTVAGPQTFNYDDRNRLTTTSAGSYAWTARGSPTSQVVGGQTTTFTSDAASRVTGAMSSGNVITYGLDGLDRVKTRTVNGTDPITFSYAGFDADPYAQFVMNPNTGTLNDVRRYSRDPAGWVFAEQGPAGFTTVGTDNHGDSNLWTSLGGYGVMSSKVYDSFGGIAGATGSQSALGFQGDYTDPTTGDVNMGARWYNPSTATFRTRDTYAGTLQTPFSVNRYTYGLNNPLRYSDPSGHYAEHAGCYRDDRSYDWDCDHALNNDGQGVETDHPLSENADGTPKSSGYSVPAPLEPPGPATTPEQLTQPNNGPAPTSNAAAGATAASGNLTYTPRALTEEEILTLFRQGNTSNAIADAALDANYIYRLSAAGTAGKVAAGSQAVAVAGAATCIETVGAGCVVAAGAEVIALGAETVVVVSSLWDLINGPAKSKAKAKNTGTKQNLVKGDEKEIERVTGENAEDIKRDVVGRKNGSKYDLYVDKETGEIFVLGKGGKGEPQPTGLKLPK